MQRLCSSMANASTKGPKDYVISTEEWKVRTFVEIAANNLMGNNNGSKSIIWEGDGINEVGKRADNKEIVIRIDPRYFSLQKSINCLKFF